MSSLLPSKEAVRFFAADAARLIRGGLLSDLQAVDPKRFHKVFDTHRLERIVELPPTKVQTLSGNTVLLPSHSKPFVLSVRFVFQGCD